MKLKESIQIFIFELNELTFQILPICEFENLEEFKSEVLRFSNSLSEDILDKEIILPHDILIVSATTNVLFKTYCEKLYLSITKFKGKKALTCLEKLNDMYYSNFAKFKRI